MLKRIRVKNLRSIRDQEVKVAPITILYGPNGSGKSTLLNALAILRNIVLNPNQPLDSFFNLGFANFGGFEQIVFNHIPHEQIELEIDSIQDSTQVIYKVTLGKKLASFWIQAGEPWNVMLKIETTFPYPANQQKSATVEYEGTPLTVNWNGIIAQVTSTTPTSESEESEKNAQALSVALNEPVEELRQSDFVHLKRGFSKPHYGTVPLTPTVFTEDEVATILANDQYLEGKASHYLEKILDRDLRVRATPGTAIFRLNTTDKATGLSTELVNDGFGVNQIVYLLSKILRRDVSLVCIEEPEIHLHPRALRNLAHVLVELSKKEQKTLIISTHSEHLILPLLSAVAKGELIPDEISCYLCNKSEGESKFEQQHVNSKGQIEGGLTTFMEGELKDLKDTLGLSRAVG